MSEVKPIRAYQAQSRLAFLHAACAITFARIAKNVTPRFNLKPTKHDVCELCYLNSLSDKQLVAHIQLLVGMASRNGALRPEVARDKVLAKGQLEIADVIRARRLEEKLDREKELADREWQTYKRAKSPVTPSLHRRATEIKQALKPEFPPDRPTKATPPRRMTEAESLARRTSDRKAILGATGEGRSAKLPKRVEKAAQKAVESIPAKASVTWLKAELLALLRTEAVHKLTPEQNARKFALDEALRQRGVVEVWPDGRTAIK